MGLFIQRFKAFRQCIHKGKGKMIIGLLQFLWLLPLSFISCTSNIEWKLLYLLCNFVVFPQQLMHQNFLSRGYYSLAWFLLRLFHICQNLFHMMCSQVSYIILCLYVLYFHIRLLRLHSPWLNIDGKLALLSKVHQVRLRMYSPLKSQAACYFEGKMARMRSTSLCM